PSASSGTPPPTGAAPPASTAQRSPAEVVTAYFDAINRGDHRAAWELGGSAFASSYDAFVAGFDGLLQDRVEVLATDGDQVTVVLEAVQADGSSRWFEGTYTVRGGRLVAADIRETSGPATAVPDEPGSGYYDTCGQAHEQGQGPFERGEDPAYRDELDRDQDGTACEWND
ncbi:excalibur calcium-binding domain-containing protein, partial [Streptomyces sparsus]